MTARLWPLLALTICACSSTRPCATAAGQLFRVEHDPGMVFSPRSTIVKSLTIYGDATIELRRINTDQVRCARLSHDELARLSAAFDAAAREGATSEHIEDDRQITLVQGTRRSAFEDYRGLESGRLAPRIHDFLALLDDIAQQHFGRAYNHSLR